MKKWLAILLIIIFLGVGFGIGKFLEKAACQADLIKKQEEINLLTSQVKDCYPTLPSEIYSVWGTIKEVGPQFLVMESKIQVRQFALPGQDKFETKEIKVKLNGETEVFKIHWPEPSQGMNEAEVRLLEPQKIFLDPREDIQPGASAFIISKENIRDKTEVEAVSIELGE